MIPPVASRISLNGGRSVYNAGLMKWILFLLVLVSGAGGFYWWRAAAESAPPSPERIVEPRRGSITQKVIAIGRVEPRTRIDVKSKANGIIRKLHVDVSEPIRRGQIIVELDQEILKARVDEAEGKLQGATAAVETERAELQRIEVEKSDPELAYSRRNWERAQLLHKDQLVSDDERDQARDRFDKAEFRLRLLEARVAVAKAAITAAEGRLKEVQAQAELARQELMEATIVSPIDGVVLHRYLEEGDSVSSIRVAGGNATLIMTLGDLSELYVDGQVDENDAGKILDQQKIRPNLEARVTVDSFRGRIFTGRVARIAPMGLEDNNGIVTFEVRILLDNPERLLLANMTANSQIVLKEVPDALLLSQGALATDERTKTRFAMVYDPDTGRTSRQEVVTGISDGSQVQIVEGLELNQKVVLPTARADSKAALP